MKKADLSSLTFRQISIFLAAAEYLSFSEAADRLHITQPLVSRTISTLENLVGFPLFVRKYRQVELTPSGRELQKKWSGLFAAAEEAVESASAVYDAQINTLNIFDDYMQTNSEYLSLCLGAFRKQYPDIKLHIEKTQPSDMAASIIKGDCDIGFIFEPELNRIPLEYFDCKKLNSRPFCVMVTPAHPLSARDSITLKELSEIPIVTINKNNSSAYHETIFGLFAEKGLTPSVASYVTSTPSLLYACREENIPMVAHSFISREPGLCYIPISDSSCALYLLWKKGNRKPSLRAFVKIASEVFQSI